MKNKKLRITEKDFLLANRRASRAEEIEKYGKQISMRSVTHKSKKVYDRNRLKKAGIKYCDDLPLLCFDAWCGLHAITQTIRSSPDAYIDFHAPIQH